MAQTTLTATNTFGEGLIMDLAPNNTQANQLTSALNATLITYNGNEFSLQNDMGNGRVETARLPEGYIPVGSCELGGIIYVASYNPITNKSQLGSFPSPERNVSSEEQNLNDISWKILDLLVDLDQSNTNYQVLNQSKLYNLGLKLNPGDEYKVSIENLGNFNELFRFQYVSLQDNNEFFELNDVTSNESSDYLIYDAKTSGTLGLLVTILPQYENYSIGYEIIDAETIKFSLPDNKFSKIKVEFNDTSEILEGDLQLTNQTGLVKYTVYPVQEYKFTDEINIIRTDLGTNIEVDFSKVGTGNLEMTRWKYYVEENYVSLDFTLNHYPKPKQTVNSLKLTLTDFFDNSTKYEIEWNPLKSGSGNFKKDIYFDKINKDSLYLVDLQLDTSEEDPTIQKSLFTSTLFNDYYSDITIQDFTTIKPKLSTTLIDESSSTNDSSIEKLVPNLDPNSLDFYKHLGVLIYKNDYTVNLSHKLQIDDPVFAKLLNITTNFEYSNPVSTLDISNEEIIDESGSNTEGRNIVASIKSDTPKSPKEKPWENKTSYQQYVDSITSKISNNNVLTISTVANSKVGATTAQSTIQKAVLKPLVYDIDTAAYYGINIYKWQDKSSTFTNENPTYISQRLELSPNYYESYYPYMGFYSAKGSSIKELQFGKLNFNSPRSVGTADPNVKLNRSYTLSNIYNRTEIQDLFKRDLYIDSTIFPVILGFVSGDDTVTKISTSGINPNFYFPLDNTLLNSGDLIGNRTDFFYGQEQGDPYTTNQRVFNSEFGKEDWDKTQLLVMDQAGLGHNPSDGYSDGFGYNYPKVVMIFMKDLEDNIYPLNFFGYYNRYAHSSLFAPVDGIGKYRKIYYKSDGSSPADLSTSTQIGSISILDPILSLLTQIFKYEYEEEITSNVIDDLIYQNSYKVIYNTSVPYTATIETSYKENYKDVSNILGKIEDYLDNSVSGEINLQHILNKKSDSICDDFRQLKNTGTSVCELAAKNKEIAALIEEGSDLKIEPIRLDFDTNVEKNTPYYIHKQSDGPLQLRKMDKGFKFNDYIADIELDGNNIYTNWLGPDKILKNQSVEILRESLQKHSEQFARYLNTEYNTGVYTTTLNFDIYKIPEDTHNYKLSNVTINLKPQSAYEYRAGYGLDNGTIEIYYYKDAQQFEDVISKNISYNVSSQFKQYGSYITITGVNSNDRFTIVFDSNYIDDVIPDEYTQIEYKSSNYANGIHSINDNSSIRISIPNQVGIQKILYEHSDPSHEYVDQEQVTVWDFTKEFKTYNGISQEYVQTCTEYQNYCRENDLQGKNDSYKGAVISRAVDDYRILQLKASNLVYENNIVHTVRTFPGEPTKVNKTISINVDDVSIPNGAYLKINIPVYAYSKTGVHMNIEVDANFKEQYSEYEYQLKPIENPSYVNSGIGAYLTLDSSGYLRLNNSAKNGNLKTLHIQGSGDYNESFHARWGYNSALKISNEYAR